MRCDASGVDTTCDAMSCGDNEKVVNHECTMCPAGKTSTGSHDASGVDTTCDVMLLELIPHAMPCLAEASVQATIGYG